MHDKLLGLKQMRVGAIDESQVHMEAFLKANSIKSVQVFVTHRHKDHHAGRIF